MRDVGRAAGPRLVPGRDLHIIGCGRPKQAASGDRCLGLRWASRIELGFPISGYRVWRRPLPQGQAVEIGTFFLPDTSDWQQFAHDAELRRPPCGPYFDAIEEEDLAELLPIIRFCDPRVPAGEAKALVERAAAFFGDTHRSDAALAFQFWPFGAVPKLDDLMADALAAAALEHFYRRQCLSLLLVLALRFEYAVLFGLAADDHKPGDTDLIYQVQASFAAGHVSAQSDPIAPNGLCAPDPPQWVTADRVPGSVVHPCATHWPDWVPPAALAPTDGAGAPLPSSAHWPRVPAALTGLSWAERPPEPTLIGHGPVLYRVGRFDHGADTAALPAPPMLPANVAFKPIGDGEDSIRGREPPHFIDTPGMPWPPLEGHYHYEVHGVDLLGVASTAGTRTSLRHHDDLRPPAPRAANAGEPILSLRPEDDAVEIPLKIDWQSAEDFAAPDVVEFRVASSFRGTRTLPLRVEYVSDGGPLHADLVVNALPLPPDSLAGTLLSLPNGDFPIVGHGTGAHAPLRVRKPGGRLPGQGAWGSLAAPSAPTPVTRIARIAHRAMVPVTAVAVLSLDPLEIEIEPTSAAPIPDDAGLGVYLHLLGSTFAGERIGPRALRVVPPRPGTPVDTRWQDWIGLADPAGALVGSPVLLFPPHQLDARVAIPLGFDGGTLSLHVTAADGASYVASPVLPVADPALANAHGNESPHATITVALRSLAPPPEANVAAFDPAQRLWARSAANYAEEAAWRVEWAPVVSAARYEVWRVLDNAVPGANRETSDLELRQLAASAGKFAVRSNRVFGTSFVDGIPGRAPVRALYRVRAISPAGIPGSFSDVIGPIYVPDVRPPRPPNILRVAAVPPEEAERSILVEWAAESEPDVRFEIWSSDAEGSNPPLQLAGSIAAGSSPDSDGRYRFVHGDRRPGRVTAYEVRAVREVLDPIDPGAEVRRDIASLPSKRLAAAALRSGPLVAPLLTGAEAGAAGVRLSWTVRDFYDSIEIRRRAPDRFGYETVGTVSGGATTFLDTPPTSGLFAYRLRAIGASRTAEADELSVEVA